MKKFKRIGTVLLAVILVLSMGVSALAANPSLIDKDAKGSITIHKFENTGTVVGSNGNGTKIENTSSFGNPMPGITFTATLLPDATSATTVAEAEAMVEEMETDDTLDTYQTSGTTNASGEYKFDNLTQGIYLVQEVASATITDTVESFLVSIPMTNPVNQSEWLYDVHVYPKNTENDPTITKAIRTDDEDVMDITADIGDTVKWVITPSIPAAIASISLVDETGYYYIIDDLDTHLDYVSATVQLVNASGTVVETLDDTYYTLTAPTTGGGGEIEVNFNLQTGLDKLLDAKANGYTLEIVIETTINETAVKNLSTAISNSAEFYFSPDGDPEDPEDPIVPTDPEVELTGLALYKYWMDGETKTYLNGAVFTIYASEDAAKDNEPMELESDTPWSKTTGVTAIMSVGTAVNGYIYFSEADLIAAVNVALDAAGEDIYDPANPVDVAAFRSDYPEFYLVETTAPTGFDLLKEAVAVPLGTTAEAENFESPNFTLPITGGSGTLLFTIIGIVLIGGAVTLLLVSRKKKKSASK